MAKRFASYDQVIEKEQLYSTRTNYATNYAGKAFLEYLESNNMTPGDFVCLSNDDQDGAIAKFFGTIRKKDGDMMKKMSFNSMKYALVRFIRKEYNIEILDATFKKTETVLRNIAVRMKHENKGYIKHYDQIPDEELAKFFRELNVNNAEHLQWYIFVLLQIHFCKRGSENVAYYTKDTFGIQTDAEGQEFIYQKTDELTKNRRENDTEMGPQGRIYSKPTWGDKCPVTCFRKYLNRLSNNNRLWQRVSSSYSPISRVWYTQQPIGVNTVSQFMRKISQQFGMSRIFTNHCLRVSSISILGRCFDENDIKTISGHSSSSSLGIYKRVDEAKKRRMANTLSSVFNDRSDHEQTEHSCSNFHAEREEIQNDHSTLTTSLDMPYLERQFYDDEIPSTVSTIGHSIIPLARLSMQSLAPIIQYCGTVNVTINNK